jgi:hypothetical protein
VLPNKTEFSHVKESFSVFFGDDATVSLVVHDRGNGNNFLQHVGSKDQRDGVFSDGIRRAEYFEPILSTLSRDYH